MHNKHLKISNLTSLDETQILHGTNSLAPDFHISMLQNDQVFIKQSLKQLEHVNNDYTYLLEEAFFSNENIELIQDGIREKVYKTSNYFIPKQNTEHIRQIMRGIYQDQGQFLPYQFKEQIKRLNDIVVEFSFPFIISQINANKKYIDFIEKPRNLVPLPQSVSVAGKRTLPSMFIC